MWLLQRASAWIMVVCLPLFLAYVLWQAPHDYARWRALFAPLPVKIAVLLFVMAMLVHGWLGLREILIDYVHPLPLRLSLYLVLGVLYLACLIWTAHILWSQVP